MFKFNFSELDLEDDENQSLETNNNPSTEQPELASRTTTEQEAPSASLDISDECSTDNECIKYYEISLDELVCALVLLIL